MLHAFFLKLKLQNNIFKHCDIFLSLGRHQTTTCTNLFSDFIIYCRFIQHSNLYWKHRKQRNAHVQALNFLHSRNWVITINQKLNEPHGINHTVQSNNRFNSLCLLNCLPCNLTYSNLLPPCYLYISMNFSGSIHGSYPRIFRQCFLINRFDPTDLFSAAYHFTLSMGSSIQTVKVCIKRS